MSSLQETSKTFYGHLYIQQSTYSLRPNSAGLHRRQTLSSETAGSTFNEIFSFSYWPFIINCFLWGSSERYWIHICYRQTKAITTQQSKPPLLHSKLNNVHPLKHCAVLLSRRLNACCKYTGLTASANTPQSSPQTVVISPKQNPTCC